MFFTLGTCLIRCACQMISILSLRNVDIYICSMHICQLRLIQWCVLRWRKYISFYMFVLYFRSVVCLLVRLNPLTSVFFVALAAFFKVVEVCVLGARELSLELSERCTNSSNALFFFNATYESRWFGGGGEFPAFSDESRTLHSKLFSCVNFIL